MFHTDDVAATFQALFVKFSRWITRYGRVEMWRKDKQEGGGGGADAARIYSNGWSKNVL